MHQLVHVHNGREKVVLISDDWRYLELVRERHTRSYAPGWMEVRSA
jgi:hypothetical protein